MESKDDLRGADLKEMELLESVQKLKNQRAHS